MAHPMKRPPGRRTRAGADHAADQRGMDHQGMDLLAAHVPLTLLLDLGEDDGPGSTEILHNEQPSADEMAWLYAALSVPAPHSA